MAEDIRAAGGEAARLPGGATKVLADDFRNARGDAVRGDTTAAAPLPLAGAASFAIALTESPRADSRCRRKVTRGRVFLQLAR
mmetsp:Transcript_113152/g.325335  ORF Transcript_113152/g.325335 Transcript_113152/m.325335 type:complete len:83 (-) Transcript_113152:1409-1657(-)